jgi:hypothetical protein
MKIGDWVKREGPTTPIVVDGQPELRGPKWHLCESVVAGDAFTHCGRRMGARTGRGGLEVSPTKPLTRMIGQPHLCRQCP